MALATGRYPIFITGIKSEYLTRIELGQQDITLEELSIIAFALGVEARTLVA